MQDNEVGVQFFDGEEGDSEYDEEEADGDVEDVEEGDEDQVEVMNPSAQYIQGLGPLPGQGSSAGAASREWEGLSKMQPADQRIYHELLERLRKQKRNSLTLLVIGKEGVGKTALVNALMNENTSPPEGFGQRQRGGLPRPRLTSRKAAGFTLNIIDCPGLSEGDSGCDMLLAEIAASLEGTPIDAVLLVDRLDVYRVDALDHQVWASITRVMGRSIWQHSLVALTHGRMNALPEQMSYDDYVQQRGDAVRSELRSAGRCRKAALPVAVVESSSRCDKDGEGCRTLPNGQRWVEKLLEQVVEVSQRGTWVPGPSKADDPNTRHRLWIPLIFAAQVAFKILVLDPMLDRDREEWASAGNPCINLEADAKKKAEWERRDTRKPTRRIHEGQRLPSRKQ